MKNTIALSLLCCVLKIVNAQSPKVLIEGRYQHENIMLINPLNQQGDQYCIDSVLINGVKYLISTNERYLELKLDSLELQEGAYITVEVFHKEGCSPEIAQHHSSAPQYKIKVNINPSYLRKLKKEYKKSKITANKADQALQIANLYRESGDTLYRQWYQKVIGVYRNESSHYETFPETITHYNIGVSYYHLDQKLQAEVWFDKMLLSGKENKKEIPSLGYYYLGKIFCEKREFKKSLYYLYQYQKLEGDKMNVKDWIQKCKEQTNKE